MPPKGKKKKEKKEVIIDGVKTADMTREALEVFALRLKEETTREREERNFFQLERDKIRTFWEITRQQLEESKSELRNKDREIEEAEEKHQYELKKYKQQIKHLLYEHQLNLGEQQADAMVSLKLAEDNYTEQESELLKDKKGLKCIIENQEISHQGEIRGFQTKLLEELDKARKKYDMDCKEIETYFEKRFVELREELGLLHRLELTEVEERKNRQISDLIKSHADAFAELKNYYNEITLNNLALIDSLKEQMQVLRNSEEMMEKKLQELKRENKKLVEPLKAYEVECKDLRRRMLNYEKDKQSLANHKKKLARVNKNLDSLTWEHDTLELVFDKMKKERDELHCRFVSAILETQQKTGLRNTLLEKKLSALNEVLEQREAQMAEVMVAARLDPVAMEAVNKKLEELLRTKNTTIQELQYELARVCKAHDDLIDTYEGKLSHLGIPKDELGFEPLRVQLTFGDQLGLGPAGLISKNE